jgi:RND family efflux transporter MFP subunit
VDRRKLILGGPAVAGAAALLFLAPKFLSGGGGEGEAAETATAVAKRGELRITVVANGTVKAKDSVRIRSEIENRSEVTWIIEEGIEVNAGDLLVELDKKDFQKTLDQLEIDLSRVETEYAAALTDVEVQRAENESNIKKAELKLERMEKELEKYREGEARDQERKLILEQDKAGSELERARKKHQDALDLEKEGFFTPAQVEEARIQLETWRVQKESADLALELFKKYTHPMTLRQKEADLEEARSELERTRKTTESQLRQKDAALKQRERARISTKQQHERANQNLERCTIRATEPGIVIYGDPDQPWRREEVKVGMSVWQNHTVLTLPNLAVLQILLQIHEADIGKVKAGQIAVVTPEADPTRHLSATVTKVSQVATSGWGWGDEVKRFAVEITIDEKDPGLQPSTTAKVEILVEEVPDVLSVPIQAVFAKEGHSFVYVANGGRAQRREVKPGRQNETHVEIPEGLRDGEIVYLYDPEGIGAASEEPAGEEAAEEESGAPGLPRPGA